MSVIGIAKARWRTVLAAVVAFGAGVLATVAVDAANEPEAPAEAAATGAEPEQPSPGPSPGAGEYVRIGGVPALLPNREITDETLTPYPFMSPTPAPTPTEVDGTYLRVMTLAEVGGPRVGIPYRCLRCPPFRIDPGVSTLVLYRGAYYIHHHLSGFRTMGSFVIEGDRMTLFNDANCPQTPGTYEFERHGRRLTFRVIEDDCPFSGERALDLEARTWSRVAACTRRIQNLWPGEVAC